MIGPGILLCLLTAFLWNLIRRFFRLHIRFPLSALCTGIAALLYLILFIQRSRAAGFIALTSLYDALLFLVLALLVILTLARLLSPPDSDSILPLSGIFIAFTATILLSSPLLPADIYPPVPLLRSYWLVFHVALTFIGEAFFTLAAALSLAWLLTSPKNPEKKAARERAIYRLVLLGYPLYTLGALLFGAVWAKQAWGRFWGWDPKEVWALVTWLVFTWYLHHRLIQQKKDAAGPLIVLTGYAAALFTLLGVSYLLPGLHSYL